MAVTFLAAIRDRYSQLNDFPRLWTARIPEGEAQVFPNALLEHTGEILVTHQSDGAGGAAEVRHNDGCRITVWDTNADELDIRMRQLMDLFHPNCLRLADGTIALYRQSYRLEHDPQRSAEGRMVFRGIVSYVAEVV